MTLAAQAVLSSAAGLVFFAAVLFWPAGTVDYWQGLLFVAVFALTTIVPTVYLAIRHPAALARRMKAGPMAETRPVQRVVITAVIAAAIATFVVSALDHRFGWSDVPNWVVLVAEVLVAIGLGGAQWVIVQNNYAGASITVEPGQTLASTGLYGLVRRLPRVHPPGAVPADPRGVVSGPVVARGRRILRAWSCSPGSVWRRRQGSTPTSRCSRSDCSAASPTW
ncbi:hypothetical protein [Mycolicibacterium gilvum]|uniref:hypothetical protein n=1 Tax=Mycolicibacterium gilvum TaxID=1804 RepID=UPI004045E276